MLSFIFLGIFFFEHLQLFFTFVHSCKHKLFLMYIAVTLTFAENKSTYSVFNSITSSHYCRSNSKYATRHIIGTKASIASRQAL